MIARPMLAETLENVADIQFPVLATDKIDGRRNLLLPPTEAGKMSRCASRSLKGLKNDFTREWLESYLPPGLDGELVVLTPDGRVDEFHVISSAFTNDGEPDFRFMVFDDFRGGLQEPYLERMKRLEKSRLPSGRVIKLLPTLIENEEELDAFEAAALARGNEGIMIRTPHSPYKEGRSTVREGWLLKIKRFKDAEGTIVGTVEGMHNANEATINEVGRTQRSTSKEGKIGKGRVGALVVKPLEFGPPTNDDWLYVQQNAHRMKAAVQSHPYLFMMGTGAITVGGNNVPLSEAHTMHRRVVKYKFQPIGVKVKPRFPQCLGYRDADDMDGEQQGRLL
jgi:DNA ligase-1